MDASGTDGPAPDGRQRTREHVVEVASRLLAEDGPDAVTTRAVSAAAGVQPPTIYRLFGDKDGLLQAVAEHAFATWSAGKTIDARLDPVEELRAGWDEHVAFGLAHPHVYTLMADPRRTPDPRATERGRAVLLARVHRLAAAGRLRVSEQHAVDVVHAVGTGTVLTLLATPAERRDATLADTAFAGVVAAITSDRPALDRPGPVAAAVALRALAPTLDTLTDAERHLLVEWLDRIAGDRGTAPGSPVAVRAQVGEWGA